MNLLFEHLNHLQKNQNHLKNINTIAPIFHRSTAISVRNGRIIIAQCYQCLLSPESVTIVLKIQSSPNLLLPFLKFFLFPSCSCLQKLYNASAAAMVSVNVSAFWIKVIISFSASEKDIGQGTNQS